MIMEERKPISQIESDFLLDWCKEFEKCKHHQTQLSQEDAKILLSLMLNESAIEDDKEFQKKVTFESFILKVIDKRLQLYSYTLTFAAKAALAWIFATNLGSNTMNMTYLQYLSSKHGKSKIDMEFIGTKVFPYGAINEDFYIKMWEAQKAIPEPIGPDNILDYPKFIEALKHQEE